VTSGEQPTGIDAHVSRLKAQQGEQRRKNRLAALSAKCVNMRAGWLLVYVEDGAPKQIREARLATDGGIILL
jgi:hypothetical protein